MFDELMDIWMGNADGRKVVDMNLPAMNGTIRLAVNTGAGEPMCYVRDGKIVGYTIDMISRFAREYGYGLEITDYNGNSEIVAAISSTRRTSAQCARRWAWCSSHSTFSVT